MCRAGERGVKKGEMAVVLGWRSVSPSSPPQRVELDFDCLAAQARSERGRVCLAPSFFLLSVPKPRKRDAKTCRSFSMDPKQRERENPPDLGLLLQQPPSQPTHVLLRVRFLLLVQGRRRLLPNPFSLLSKPEKRKGRGNQKGLAFSLKSGRVERKRRRKENEPNHLTTKKRRNQRFPPEEP